MKRIVININTAATSMIHNQFYAMKRAVVRTDKIVGLTEDVFGNVELTIKTSDDAVPHTVVITNTFEEVSKAMM